MNENQIAIDSGLRTEIAEDFIGGLKTLFKEHFIEVPEEKYDVIEELSAKTGALEEKLNSSISENIELTQELSALKAQQVLEQETKTLARTDAEKLMKLVEGVEFDSEEVYREKVRVIKENYFPKAPKQSPDSLLIEESGEASFNGDQTMNKYVQALARTIKNR
jgi:regulator of replication initiation timing